MWPEGAILGVVLSVLLAGCGGGPQQGGFEMPPMPVEAAQTARQTITDEFSAVGTIDAINAIQVVSENDGKIVALPFKEGGAVDNGQLIAQLDDEQLRAERDRAQAVRDQRQVTFERIRAIVEQGAGSKQDLDDASAALKVAEADLALASARLSKTQISAPFAGIVGAKQVSIGEFIRSGQTITDLAQIDELKVTFSAPERFYPLLHKGASITVYSPAFADRTLKGEINVIEPVVNQSTRSVSIVAHLRNPQRVFRPGMSANVTAVLNRRDSALVIPSEAVFAEGNQMLVFVINGDGSVARTPIQLGTRTAEMVEVLGGLSDGQQVVKAGHQKLFDGAKVMTGPPPAAPGQQGAPDAAGAPPAQADTTAGGK
jgi:membrane fusion protein (multidrug efflux system)